MGSPRTPSSCLEAFTYENRHQPTNQLGSRTACTFGKVPNRRRRPTAADAVGQQGKSSIIFHLISKRAVSLIQHGTSGLSKMLGQEIRAKVSAPPVTIFGILFLSVVRLFSLFITLERDIHANCSTSGGVFLMCLLSRIQFVCFLSFWNNVGIMKLPLNRTKCRLQI